MDAEVNFIAPPRLGNDSAKVDELVDLAQITTAAARKIAELLDVLGADHHNDHNTRGTPLRVAKMLVEELLIGRYTEMPNATEFDNAGEYDHLIVIGPIDIRSTCAHHMMPIFGSAFIGVMPSAGGKIIGLSKYDRIVHHFCARLQIQEELVVQIANYIQENLNAGSVAVRISAVHMCRVHRGVRAKLNSRMVCSFYTGIFRENQSLKDEFTRECHLLEGN